MILAWISFGLNNQLVSTSFEDLKIFLNVDYQRISVAPIARVTSYMIVTLFIGYFLDKYVKKSEIIMAIGKVLMILRKSNAWIVLQVASLNFFCAFKLHF